MNTANASFENRHVNALFSFHTENLLYQKSVFRAIGEIYVFGKKPKFHIIGISAGKITYTSTSSWIECCPFQSLYIFLRKKSSSPFWEAARKSFRKATLRLFGKIVELLNPLHCVLLVESKDTINVSVAEPHTAARQDEVFYSFVWTANTNLSDCVPVPLTI